MFACADEHTIELNELERWRSHRCIQPPHVHLHHLRAVLLTGVLDDHTKRNALAGCDRIAGRTDDAEAAKQERPSVLQPPAEGEEGIRLIVSKCLARPEHLIVVEISC